MDKGEMAVLGLSFSSDTSHTAAQYVDEAVTCTEVTPPTGNPRSRVCTQRVNKPINDLNDGGTAIQDELKAMYSDMPETLQAFENVENTTASSLNASNER